MGGSKQVVFQNIMMAAMAAGLIFPEETFTITPADIKDDRILFDQDEGRFLRDQIIGLDTFAVSNALERAIIKLMGILRLGGHRGMNDFVARQRVGRFSLQFGYGGEGAFLDIDEYNPTVDLYSFFAHQAVNDFEQQRLLEMRGHGTCN